MASVVGVDYLASRLLTLSGKTFCGRKIRRTDWSKRVYKSKDRLIRPERKALKRYMDIACEMLSQEVELSQKAKEPIRITPPNAIWANRNVWLLIHSLLTNRENISKKINNRVVFNKQIFLDGINSSRMRTVNDKTTHKPTSPSLFDEGSLTFSSLCIALSEEIKDQWDLAGKKFVKHVHCPEQVDVSLTQRGAVLDILAFSDIVLITHMGEEYMLTPLHLTRLIELLRSLSNLTVAIGEIKTTESPVHVILDWIRMTIRFARTSPESIGEFIKAARNLLVASLAHDQIMGTDPVNELSKAYTLDKREIAKEYMLFYKEVTTCTEDAINLACMYKYVPHPDTNLQDMWSTIKGLKDPNRIDPQLRSRARGVIRRTLYRSMKASKHYVTLTPTGPLGHDLAKSTNATQVSISQVAGKSSMVWNDVKFDKVHTIIPPSKMTVPPSDKSSQTTAELTANDLIGLKNWAEGGGLDDMGLIGKKIKPINDIRSTLEDKSEFSYKRAIKRLEHTIKLHEKFESKFIGVEPEDIPQIDFEKFIEETPSARYIVGTEPKAGEFHKTLTRLFYMAEQSMKTITQRVERLARQVSRLQTGVSITKGYAARRKDLEQFCESMIGMEGDIASVFVSFDMSEFSKKFPMALIRDYGSILAEITGEEWLSRIDIIFRASVVVHNTRRYSNYMTGVKGGFEGFLNFVWSSIHAVIMEISLEATGLSGQLLTFSDDGLLMFRFPMRLGKNVLRNKVLAIRNVYSRLGLEFHLGKTLVSTIVWEYLGDVCFENKLLPMWVKESSRFGIYTPTKGVNTVHTLFSAHIGQARALAKSGLTAETAYTLMYNITSLKLHRLDLEMTNRLRDALLIIPFSCGGYRIPSPPELSSSTSIESTAEFYADLEFLQLVDRELCSIIVYAITTSLVSKSRAIQLLCNGQRLATTMPDTSGLSVEMKLLELLTDKYSETVKLISTPLTSGARRELENLLKKVANIDPKTVSKVVGASPRFVDFTRSIAILKSNGAAKLLSLRVRRSAQSRDTWNCRRSIQVWKGFISRGTERDYPPSHLYRRAEEKIFPMYLLATMKPSGRSILTLTDDEADIIVDFSFSGRRSLIKEEYTEPRIRFPRADTTLSWFSQASGDTSQAATRNFLRAVAEAVATDPQSANVYANIAAILGCPIPFIPAGPLANMRRLTAAGYSQKAVDVSITPPRPQWAKSTVRYSGSLQTRLATMTSADRTTYLELARVYAIEIITSKINYMASTPTGVVTVKFLATKSAFKQAFTNPTMVPREGEHIREPIYRREQENQLSEEFHTSMREFYELRRASNQIVTTTYSGNRMTEEERMVYQAVLIESLSRWIVESLMSANSPVLPYADIPIPMFQRIHVIISAVLKSAWRILHPRLKADFIPLASAISPMQALATFRQIREEPKIEYLRILGAISLSLIDLDTDLIPVDTLKRLEVFDENHAYLLATSLSGDILAPSMGSRLVVIRSGNDAEGKMSASHRVAYRQAFSNTISHILGRAKALKWKSNELKQDLGVTVNVDLLLDWLFITRDLIRESDHRGTQKPYNQTTAIIQMFKVYTFIDTLMNAPGITDYLCDKDDYGDPCRPYNVTNQKVKEVMWGYRLPENSAMYLYDQLAGDDGKLGGDHAQIIYDDIPMTYSNRIRHHLNAFMNERPLIRNYRDASVVEEIRLDQHAFYQMIIAGAAAKLIDVPRQFETLLRHTLSPGASNTLDSYNIEVQQGFIGGIPWNPRDAFMDDDIVNLLTEMLKDYTLRHGIGLINPLSDTTGLLTMLTDRLGSLSSRGTTLGLDAALEDRFAAIRLICREFRDEDEAFTTYVNLSSRYSSSLTVFKHSESQRIFLIGYTTSDEVDVGERLVQKPMFYTNDYPSTMSLLPICTFKEMEADIKASLSPFIVGQSYQTPRTGVSAFRTSYSRAVGLSSQVNNESPLLAAACLSANSSSCPEDLIWSYCLFRFYMKSRSQGAINFRDIRQYYKDVIENLNEGYERVANMLRSDIGTVAYYLSLSHISQGIDINMDFAANLASRRPKIGSALHIGLEPTYGIPKKICELGDIDDLAEDDVLWPVLFKAADPVLYQIATVPESSEEEDSDSDYDDIQVM
uniref:RNA-dependent RNA polymerase n=1 Tax=Bremia lactucae associated yuevirus-like virus 1 TaxID=2719814 RepID=A0A6G9ELF5_9VIRU|nr:MAG: RNA-dependent RNA polymerase [Bremia lactucae associated yuevirus-like virus 1]